MRPVKVLMVGCDKGSWQMRGKQLGAALGAHCTAKPQGDDWKWAQVVVLVKRAAETWFREARASGAVVLWDVLDVWRQPSANQTQAEDLIRYVTQTGRALKAQLIGATRAMATDIGGVYLPHQSRLGLTPAPPSRSRAAVVGYDGSERYLGSWRPALERACACLGLRFVVNPPDLREVDVLVAFRGEQWDGWACRRWKSGVKYVNAIAAGRPILTQACAAFDEIQPMGGTIEDPADLVGALETLTAASVRHAAYEHGVRRAHEFTLDAIAQQYQAVIQAAVRRYAA